MKYYFVTFEFMSGEYGYMGYHSFATRSIETLGKALHRYLRNFYGKGTWEPLSDWTYLYFGGKIAITVEGWREVSYTDYLTLKRYIN